MRCLYVVTLIIHAKMRLVPNVMGNQTMRPIVCLHGMNREFMKNAPCCNCRRVHFIQTVCSPLYLMLSLVLVLNGIWAMHDSFALQFSNAQFIGATYHNEITSAWFMPLQKILSYHLSLWVGAMVIAVFATLKMQGDEWQQAAKPCGLCWVMYGHPVNKLNFMGNWNWLSSEWNHDVP